MATAPPSTWRKPCGERGKLPDADDFPALGAAYEASPAPAVKTGKIGAAECRLAEFVPAVDFAREWFLANRRETKR